MPKYYCDYCKSYLTHDTMSVRKSHLLGKNHIRYYCNYFEQKARETGVWNPNDAGYAVGLGYVSSGAPGGATKTGQFALPPPPNLDDFPNPPPGVVRNTESYQAAIMRHLEKADV